MVGKKKVNYFSVFIELKIIAIKFLAVTCKLVIKNRTLEGE